MKDTDRWEIYDEGFQGCKRVLKNGKAINEFGMLKEVESLLSQNEVLKRKLIETVSELRSMIDRENEKLKAGICSTDLDDPDYLDYQTVNEAMELCR